MAKHSWFEILTAARRLCPEGASEFTAEMLAQEAGIEDTQDTWGSQIASAWLNRFTRWGYVSKKRKLRGPGAGRPRNLYLVTPKGLECKPKEGWRSRLARLVASVRYLEQTRGTKSEQAAFRALVKTADEVETKEEKRNA